ncbi:uncharacterized protein [Amphiura filiformis]|uniref:uncharacterized protein n=1 Tax=Amphiura filiformis TaxID=82378 RepID=UPI003B215330
MDKLSVYTPKLSSSAELNSHKQLSTVMDNNLPLRRPKIAIFASPEAESARDSIDIEDEMFLADNESDTKVQNDSCVGLDIELQECQRFQREKKTAWVPEQKAKPNQRQSAANHRWKKATISARLCVDLTNRKKSGLESDEKDSVSEKKDLIPGLTLNRRRWRKVGLCVSMNAMLLKDVNKSKQEKKFEQKANAGNDDSSVQISEDNISGSGRTETKTSGRTIPSTQRFGRRLSPQVSRSLPDKFKPSPPPSPRRCLTRRTQSESHSHLDIPHGHAKPFRRISSPALSSRSSSPPSSTCSSPTFCRRKLSLASDSSLPNSPPSSTCSSPKSERKRLSLASDLETNRSIVEDLMHQRSEAISHLSNERNSRCGRKNVMNCDESPIGRRSTQAWEPLKSHEDIVLTEKLPKADHAISKQRLEEAELTEYYDIAEGHCSSLSLKELKQTSNFNLPELVCLESDSISECKSRTSSSSNDSSITESTGSMKSFRTSNKTDNTKSCSKFACNRTDADIVKDVEEEIQQRVSRRKQQLIQQAGGQEHHGRLQLRARARSTGGQLRRVLSDMHEKRTTSELWQMAVEKSKLQSSYFSHTNTMVLSVH